MRPVRSPQREPLRCSGSNRPQGSDLDDRWCFRLDARRGIEFQGPVPALPLKIDGGHRPGQTRLGALPPRRASDPAPS